MIRTARARKWPSWSNRCQERAWDFVDTDNQTVFTIKDDYRRAI